MANKIKIKETIIVEGKYDRIKLKSIADANIITTDGFKIFNNSERQALIRNIAKKTGIIVMTDSDTAGRKIRNFIKNCVKSGESGDNADNENSSNILNVYVPKILGKEKRKTSASKENLLGVEGTDKDILINVLNKFGVLMEKENINDIKKITKTDFYEDKLTGSENSSDRRKCLCKMLDIPHMSSNALVEAVNILVGYDEYKRLVNEINDR
ncbi:MAG: DUF4093 domain-containing protein [Oscillospiraceae bacterium]|nr:DUF4093 domain-containing protein [Oscillospiraceae bacterium]